MRSNPSARPSRLALALALVLALAAGLAGRVSAAEVNGAREAIHIVGSTTVSPFASAVAERLSETGRFVRPIVDTTGTGMGIKRFCGGVGDNYPDIVNASRRIKPAEYRACEQAGVKAIVEIRIGFDGIVLARAGQDRPPMLTRRMLYLALARQVPDPGCPACGKLVDNPYRRWAQIDPALPDVPIEIYGPAAASGTRDAFGELVMEPGCSSFDWLKDWKPRSESEFRRLCRSFREDGVYEEIGENYARILELLKTRPGALGLFGYSFLDAHRAELSASPIEQVTPAAGSIADGRYPISRPLYFYVKKAQIGHIPGIVEYIEEFTRESAWGDQGYLLEKGLVPLPQDQRRASAATARQLELMKM